MFNDKDFHNLIEQQNPEQKQKSLDKLMMNLPEAEVEVALNNGTAARLLKKKAFIIPCIAVFLCIVICAVVLPFVFNKKDGNSLRFCEAEDYVMESSLQSLKQYSEENNKSWLYFDWYDISDDYTDYIYKLKSNNEVVCFSETILDTETGYSVSINITDNKTEIDFLDEFKSCDKSGTYSGIEVKWYGSTFLSMAMFEYNGFKYYISIDFPDTQDLAVDYAKLLLE